MHYVNQVVLEGNVVEISCTYHMRYTSDYEEFSIPLILWEHMLPPDNGTDEHPARVVGSLTTVSGEFYIKVDHIEYKMTGIKEV